MSDETRSGNRWEPENGPDATAPIGGSSNAPSAAGTATAQLDRPATEESAAPAASLAHPAASAPAAGSGWRRWRDTVSTRAAILLAAGTFLLGGIVGFGLAHVFRHDPQVVPQQGQFGPGQRPDGDGFGRGFGPRGDQQDGQQNGQQNGQQDGSQNGQQGGGTGSGGTSGSTT